MKNKKDYSDEEKIVALYMGIISMVILLLFASFFIFLTSQFILFIIYIILSLLF